MHLETEYLEHLTGLGSFTKVKQHLQGDQTANEIRISKGIFPAVGIQLPYCCC